MDDGQFQWDDRKAAANLAKHNISFEMARDAFRDPFALDWSDETQDPTEPRFSLLGMVEGRLLFVGYTVRGDCIRIITARRAEPFERRRYHDENQT